MGPRDFAEASREGPKSIQASSQAPAGATLSGQDATITTCTSCISASRGFLAYMFFSDYSFMASTDSWHSYSSADSTTTYLFGWTNDWNIDELMEGSPSGVPPFSTNCVRSTLQEMNTLQDEPSKLPSLPLHGCCADGLWDFMIAPLFHSKPLLEALEWGRVLEQILQSRFEDPRPTMCALSGARNCGIWPKTKDHKTLSSSHCFQIEFN